MGWLTTRTFCNMPGVAKRPWSALCVVARSLSPRWMERWEGRWSWRWRCRGGRPSCWTRWEYRRQFLKGRNGNPQELCWQLFLLLAPFVLTSRRRICPICVFSTRQMSNLEQGFFPMNPLSEMSWAVRLPCLFSVYGLDFTTQLASKNYQKFQHFRISMNRPHYHGKSCQQLLNSPHLFVAVYGPPMARISIHWIHLISRLFFAGGKWR